MMLESLPYHALQVAMIVVVAYHALRLLGGPEAPNRDPAKKAKPEAPRVVWSHPATPAAASLVGKSQARSTPAAEDASRSATIVERLPLSKAFALVVLCTF